MLEIFNKVKYISPVVDPFNKDSFDNMAIYVERDNWNEEHIIFRGIITFKNKDTNATQKFRGSDLADLLRQMEAFMQHLK